MSIVFDKWVDSTALYNSNWPALNAGHLANITVLTPQLELSMVILTAYSAARLDNVSNLLLSCQLYPHGTSSVWKVIKKFKAANENLFSGPGLQKRFWLWKNALYCCRAKDKQRTSGTHSHWLKINAVYIWWSIIDKRPVPSAYDSYHQPHAAHA